MTAVQVEWQVGGSVSDWPEKCVRVLERFGLPGNKYQTELTEYHMVFHFKDPEDALVAKLMLGI